MRAGARKTDGRKHPPSFVLSRVVIASVAGAFGGAVGFVLSFLGGKFLDERFSYPLGSSDGFLVLGHLTSLMAVLGLLGGVWLMALEGHRVRGGRGGSGWGLAWTLLGCFAMIVVCKWNTAIFAPALLLPPIATALGLEFTAMDRGGS